MSRYTEPSLRSADSSGDVGRAATPQHDFGLQFPNALESSGRTGDSYCNGSYEEARDALSVAVELSSSENAGSFFLRAMTLEKLNDGDGARRWYDRAVARMDETYPKNPELVARKQEATELLGSGS